MDYNNPTPIPPYQSPQGPPEKKNPGAMVAIVLLATLCAVLGMLVIGNYINSGKNDMTTDVIQTIPTPSHNVNYDSIELEQLRDSLRNATPQSAAGNLYAAASLEKMNVLYIGVDNPVTISVYGFDAADLTPSITGGSLSPTGKPGGYIIRVASGTKATLTIAAKVNGVSKSVATYDYRIKRVPDPVAYVGSVKGDGKMTKTELNSQSGVFARMENFDFDLKFEVVSFVMSMNVNGVNVEKKADGPAITPDMKTLTAKAKPGEKVIFEQVIVKGPDGTMRKIPGVVIDVK